MGLQLTRTLPPMMQVMRDIGGVEIPESLAKLAGEGGDARPADNGRPATSVAGEESAAKASPPVQAK